MTEEREDCAFKNCYSSTAAAAGLKIAITAALNSNRTIGSCSR